jgi:hypothetical protein
MSMTPDADPAQSEQALRVLLVAEQAVKGYESLPIGALSIADAKLLLSVYEAEKATLARMRAILDGVA